MLIKVKDIIGKFRYNEVVYVDHTTLFPLPISKADPTQMNRVVDVISVSKDIVTIYAI